MSLISSLQLRTLNYLVYVNIWKKTVFFSGYLWMKFLSKGTTLLRLVYLKNKMTIGESCLKLFNWTFLLYTDEHDS